MASSLTATQATLAKALEWREGYKPVALDEHLQRKWTIGGDALSAIQIIQTLPDAHKPHLPEGYIWIQEEEGLKIFKHQHAPLSSFHIHLFGPDKKNRIQYIVEKDGVPQQGFAMARREGFPKDLRNEYPMEVESFRLDGIPQYRGHIIDYMDTLGTPEEENISTLQSWNFKPEPPDHWARTLRKEIVKEIRDIEGSYAEIMLYGFSPTNTAGGYPIPRTVVLETFLATQEFLKSYHIPQDHPCHGWTAKQHPTKSAIRELQGEDLFSALVWKPETLPILEIKEIPIHSEYWDVKKAYRLLRSAEMEYDQATFKILYIIYGLKNQAPLKTLEFWFLRAVDIAKKVDAVYHSSRPPFPVYLIGYLQKDLAPAFVPYLDDLKRVAERVLQAPSPLDHQVPSPTQVKLQKSVPVKMVRAFPDGPISILCSGSSRDEEESIASKISYALETQGVVILKGVITLWANNYFHKIQKQIRESASLHQPIKRVEIKTSRWEKTVSPLARTCFGRGVEIVVLE